jgi:hypothetical protein
MLEASLVAMNPISIALQAGPPFLLTMSALLSFAICAHAADPAAPPAPSDKAAHNAWALREVVRKVTVGEKIDPALFKEFENAQNAGLKTGPEVGARVPDFQLPDHNGKQWSLHQLMGSKGLLLVFSRSAAW